MSEETLRVCIKCGPAGHAENCPDCFGWGVTPTGGIVTGGQLQKYKKEGGWIKCETCGGTPEGEWLND